MIFPVRANAYKKDLNKEIILNHFVDENMIISMEF